MAFAPGQHNSFQINAAVVMGRWQLYVPFAIRGLKPNTSRSRHVRITARQTLKKQNIIHLKSI